MSSKRKNYYQPAVEPAHLTAGQAEPMEDFASNDVDDIEAQLNRELAPPVMGDEDGFDNSLGPDPAWNTPTQLNPETPKTEEELANEARRQRLLVISFILMVMVGLGNRIFNVLQMIPMNNYPLWINMISTFVYLPACFAYIWPMLKWGKQITDEALAIPKYKFAVMGALDSIAGIMQVLAVNYISNGSLVTLLMQAAVPVSMVISKIFLKTQYKLSQYFGALIVAGGLAVVLVPVFVDPPKQDDSQQAQPKDVPLWSIVLIASMIPQCLSSVYKEKALGEVEIDVIYLNGWVAVFQFLLSIPLLFPSAPASALAIDQIPNNLWAGTKCFVGIDTVMSGSNKDDCAMSPIYVSIYLVFNLAYNILIIMILKYGSSNLLWLAMTVMVPLGNVSFSLPFMPHRQTLKVTDIIGLIVVLSGLVAYRFAGKAWKRMAPCCMRYSKPCRDCFNRSAGRPVSPTVQPLLGAGSQFAPDSPLLFGKAAGGSSPTTATPTLGAHHTVKAKREEDRAANDQEDRANRRANKKVSSRAAKPSSRAEPINAETP